MSKIKKIREKILFGFADANIDFDDLRRLLVAFSFDERTSGSDHIFTRVDVEEIINIQPKQNKAKAYQVKQVRNILLKYRLGETNE